MKNALTPNERVLRAVMIARVREKEPEITLTYSELGDRATEYGWTGVYPMLEPPFRGLGEALGNISRYEFSLGRPLLSAIIVKQESRRPGVGFFTMLAQPLGHDVSDQESYWQSEIEALVDFWRDDDPTRITDAAFGRILEQLRRIRRDL